MRGKEKGQRGHGRESGMEGERRKAQRAWRINGNIQLPEILGKGRGWEEPQ